MVWIRNSLAALLLAVTAAFATPVAAQGNCVSGRDGRALVESGEIVPISVAVQRAGISRQDVQDASVCRAGGGYVYRVLVVSSGGPARTIEIPAN